jgi:hypothetical protein
LESPRKKGWVNTLFAGKTISERFLSVFSCVRGLFSKIDFFSLGKNPLYGVPTFFQGGERSKKATLRHNSAGFTYFSGGMSPVFLGEMSPGFLGRESKRDCNG